MTTLILSTRELLRIVSIQQTHDHLTNLLNTTSGASPSQHAADVKPSALCVLQAL